MPGQTAQPSPEPYKNWIGVPAILHTTVGELCVPLRGMLIGEAASTLRVRIGEGWHIDIYKDMVLHIEKDRWYQATQ